MKKKSIVLLIKNNAGEIDATLPVQGAWVQILDQGIRSHMPQLKILHVPAKTQPKQIN